MSEAQMSKREKVVAVAKDVLKHVQTYHWCRGVYLSGSWRGVGPLTGDLQDNVSTVERLCSMCLLGACLVSKARLFNAVPMFNLCGGSSYSISVNRDDIDPLLQDVFSPLELSTIESAFERHPMGMWRAQTPSDRDLLRSAAIFGMRYVNDDDRVVAVMENIIANDGVFVVDLVSEADYDKTMMDHTRLL